MSEQDNDFNIVKLAKENGFIPTVYADGECYADIETLKQFAEAYCTNATAEANKRIEALELEVQNWKDFCKKVQKIDFNDYLALQADNKRLREALVNCLDMIGHEDNIEYINKVLSATPAESLQAFENEVIEKCAKVCDHVNNQYSDIFKDTKDRFNDGASYGADDCAESIRDLKGK